MGSFSTDVGKSGRPFARESNSVVEHFARCRRVDAVRRQQSKQGYRPEHSKPCPYRDRCKHMTYLLSGVTGRHNRPCVQYGILPPHMSQAFSRERPIFSISPAS